MSDASRNVISRRSRLWSVVRRILLWGTVFGFSGVALVAFTNKLVIWSSSDSFCGKFCHSMTWASAAYQQGHILLTLPACAQAVGNATFLMTPAT